MTNSNTLTLIGWDEILCRPIYRRSESPSILNPKSRKKKSVVTNAPSLPVFHPPTPTEFKRRPRSAVDGDIYNGESENNEEVGQESKRRRKQRARSSAILGNTRKSHKSEMVQSFSPRKHNIKTGDTGTNMEEIPFDRNTLIDDGNFESAGLAAVDDECDIESNNASSLAYECDASSASSQYNALPVSKAEKVDFDYAESSSNAKEKEVVSEQHKLLSTGSYKTQPIDSGSPSSGRIHIMSENQTGVHDHVHDHIHAVGKDVSEESCVLGGCYENVDHVAQSGQGRNDIVTSPLEKQKTEDSVKQSTNTEESKDYLIGDNGKQYLLQSPMLLGYNQESEESSYTDTIGTSLLGNMETDQVFYPDSRRSYGQSNKPNWTSKIPTKHKIDLEVGQKQLVGWDEKKGRPIYHVSKPKPIIQSKEVYHVEEQPAAEQILSQKRRVYTSQYRKSGVFKAARHNMDFDSPTSRRVTLDIKDVVGGQAKRNMNNEDSSDLDTAFDIESSESAHREASDSDPYEDASENRIQPTSKSSISSAAAFFRYLDSNHNLNITNEDSGHGRNTKAGVTRTTREIMYSDQLRYEYGVYHSTVSASGLAPISVDEFARHWNLYYTARGIIRDGLLDEDD